MDKSTSFTIGKVTGVHGLNGNLKVCSFAASMDTFCPGRLVFLKSGQAMSTPYSIVKVSAHKKGVILQLDGVDSRNLAEDLVGCEVLIERDQLPEPEKDTWYWQDLYGLEVVDRDRGFIGKISKIFPTGANDVLVVTDNTRETLVTMHKHFVDSIDMDAGTMKTTLPEDY